MSDQKAFAKFPSPKGGYQYLDIFVIEAIGQSTEPTLAVVFGATERFYQIEVTPAELERSGEPDAASWALSLVSKTARMALGEYDEAPEPRV